MLGKHTRFRFVLLAGAALLVLARSGCENPSDLSGLPRNIVGLPDTAYVLLNPSFGGFLAPRAILVGNDQLLYVADSGASLVTMMNSAGQVLSTRSILHPISLAQDSRLDLLVGGEIESGGTSVAALFRIHLVSANPDSAHRLDLARIDTVWRELAKPSRRLPGITIFGDNTYLVARTGTDNASFIDPDGRILLFDYTDRFITPVPGLVTTVGTGITTIYKPSGIASFPGVRDFILTQSSEGVAYGAIWMKYQQNADFTGWLPKFDPANPDQQGTDFIRPNRFQTPAGVAIDRVRRDVFIADAALDSVFKFNSFGRFKGESFGYYQTGGLMRRPSGIAYFEQVLYVVDGVSGQVLRFRLTTDIPR